MKKCLSFIFITLIFCACASVPGTGRKQLIMVSPAEEERTGEQAFKEILAGSKVLANTPDARRVAEVGRRIAAVSGKNYKWEFVLIEDKQINAFCLPGGKVAVYTGILPIAKDDDGLAVIMGHEIAHAIARHSAERMSQNSLLNLGGSILEVIPATSGYGNVYGAAATIGFMLPYSRKHESEADELGLMLMAKAGYNPQKAAEFWQRMSASGSGAGASFLSTHPSDSKRIADIQKLLPKVMPYYYQAIGRF